MPDGPLRPGPTQQPAGLAHWLTPPLLFHHQSSAGVSASRARAKISSMVVRRRRLPYEPKELRSGDIVEIANVNEDVNDVLAYPLTVRPYA